MWQKSNSAHIHIFDLENRSISAQWYMGLNTVIKERALIYNKLQGMHKQVLFSQLKVITIKILAQT